ncbi:MAG: tyrosine-type recombinase/integrase [Lachnospiraceae bacterium]
MSRKCTQYQQTNLLIASFLADSKSASNITPNNIYSELIINQLLQICDPRGIMSMPARAKTMLDFSEKEEKVKELYNLSRIKVRPDDGRIYLVVKRKPITSTSYIGLIEKLYDLHYNTDDVTMKQYFEIWMDWRARETSVTQKTISDNRFLWNAMLKDTDISKASLKLLKIQDYISYFRQITKGREITRKRFNDLKSIMNGVLYLAVENGIIDHNYLRDINYKRFTYKPENTNIAPYTEDERQQIIHHLSASTDDFYSLAILFDFHLVLRIGELKGLKWADIKDNCIFIQRFVNDKNQIIEDTKGHTTEGKRYIPLTPTAFKLLEKIKILNPDSDYIFIRNGQPLSTVTFNRRLKKCCQELNIEYRSSHKLRFSTASIMYKNGMSDTELQKLLGHTSLAMTQHYLRNITPEEETASKMRAILG